MVEGLLCLFFKLIFLICWSRSKQFLLLALLRQCLEWVRRTKFSEERNKTHKHFPHVQTSLVRLIHWSKTSTNSTFAPNYPSTEASNPPALSFSLNLPHSTKDGRFVKTFEYALGLYSLIAPCRLWDRVLLTIDFDFNYLHHIRPTGKYLVDLDFLTFEFGCWNLLLPQNHLSLRTYLVTLTCLLYFNFKGLIVFNSF